MDRDKLKKLGFDQNLKEISPEFLKIHRCICSMRKQERVCCQEVLQVATTGAFCMGSIADYIVETESCPTERLWISVAMGTSWTTHGEVIKAGKILQNTGNRIVKV